MDRITVRAVRETARTIVMASPNAINPRDTRGCLYTKQPDSITNRAETADHCLGGAVLLALGAALPSEHVLVDTSPDSDRFDTEAMEYLLELQLNADRTLNTWLSAYEETERAAHW